MDIKAEYEIWTGGGNGMYTLRQFNGYDSYGGERFAHIKNFIRVHCFNLHT